jgi:phosphopantothenoylcysteine synthetase/decarboxylase
MNVECMRAVVTSGGTVEPIDDVRVITNLSTGTMGHQIAGRLASKGIDVIEICSESSLRSLSPMSGVTYDPFTTSNSLAEKLNTYSRADIVVHSAAVSDYIPITTQGKIRSNQEELNIRLVRAPKIISQLRDLYGDDSFLVGFKLLSGSTDDELIEASLQQLTLNKLDLVVGNDLKRFTPLLHPVLLTDKNGEAERISAEKSTTAMKIADYILRRASKA